MASVREILFLAISSGISAGITVVPSSLCAQSATTTSDGGTQGLRPRARVCLDAPTVEGAPLSAAISRSLAQPLAEVVLCYARELSIHSDVAGTVNVQVNVQPTGLAGGVIAIPAVGNNGVTVPAILTCINDGYGALRFPRARTAYSIHTALTFVDGVHSTCDSRTGVHEAEIESAGRLENH